MPTDRPVICAIDDTDVARRAADAAAWLADELDLPLVLAHAFDPDGIGMPPLGELAAASISVEDLERAARERARRLLRDAARAVGVKATRELPEGRPVDALLDLAVQRDAPLLVTGTAARAGLDRVLMGSVSAELAARAPCPVVAVPPAAALQARGPLLAGYDGSESMRCAQLATRRRSRRGSSGVSCSCTCPRPVTRAHAPTRNSPRGLYAHAARAFEEKLGRRPLEFKLNLVVGEGDPVRALARTGREQAAALIVTGTRGRNAVSSELLGSVSAGVVRSAERPVALVPPTASTSV